MNEDDFYPKFNNGLDEEECQSELSFIDNFSKYEIPSTFQKNDSQSNNKISQESTKVTKHKETKKEKIFEIKKKKRNCGRKSKKVMDNKKGKHNKEYPDNLRDKIKRTIYKHTLNFINKLIQNLKNNKKKFYLRKINTKLIFKCKKEKILELLNIKVKDILSINISKHHKKIENNFNKKIIDLIFKQYEDLLNENLAYKSEEIESFEKIIKVFNKTFGEMIEIYIDINEQNQYNFYKDFIKLKDDIKNFREKGEKINYIQKYENYARNFIKNIENIDSRNNQNNNNE